MQTRCAIGIDIGGTFTKIALVGAGGQILWQTKMRTGSHGDPEGYLSGLCDVIRPLMEQGPAGIGLSLPGLFASDCRSMVFNPNTPALEGIDFVDCLGDFHLPVRLEQDLNAPALAEYTFGSGRNSRRFLAASMGTGAGAGVIIAGEMLRFAGNTTGDCGHIILDPGGPLCTAGCHGCAEALVTAPAIERLAERAFTDPRGARLQTKAEDGKIPSQAVIAAAQGGDPLAVEIIAETGCWVGQWLASLAPVFIPDTMALCGGVSEAGEALLRACRKRFYELTGPCYADCAIELGAFRSMAGVIGAAAPFLEE